MQQDSLNLFIEIGDKEIIFTVGEVKNNIRFTVLHLDIIPIEGINKNKLLDVEIVSKIFKKNIYSIEQKLNFVFKEVTIIINNFENSIINFSGYLKLNGSQLVKENVFYILNSLKSKIDEIETNKIIVHMFNSKFLLDKQEVENLPIGLFGKFYCHELSFFLMNKDDYKDIELILNDCNLKLKKLVSKNFIQGAYLINTNQSLKSFFIIELDKQNSQITFFDNSSLKYVQNFEFGSEIILNDIKKVTGLTTDILENILKSDNFLKDKLKEDYVEKDLFINQNFRKIKKKLIFDIAEARIRELVGILFYKNINISEFLKNKLPIYFIKKDKNINCFDKIFKLFLSDGGKYEIRFSENFEENIFYENVYKIVQYGWKREAVPIVNEKKSIIARFFDLFFK